MEQSQTTGARLSRLFDRILLATAYISGAIIVIMMLSMSFDVAMRYFFDMPTRWAGDFSGYMQYFLVLLGAAWVLSIRGHTRIDILVTRFSKRTQQYFALVTSCIGLIACALFVYVGTTATLTAITDNEFLYRDIELPLWPFYAFIPLCFTLLCIQFGRMIYRGWIALQRGEKKP
jgi:TRAP-type mannitol/chloroaromatic compound transport system permease small subunit